MFHPKMLATLRTEADALAALPAHANHRSWSINAFAGTVRDLRNDDLIAYLHPVVLDPIPGFWFFPHHGGST